MVNKIDSSPHTNETAPRNSLFKIVAFRELFFANLVSNFGTQIQVVAAAWLMASMTESAQLIALVQSAMALPIMLFSLVGGAIADIYDRRRLMLIAHLFMVMMALGLAVITFSNHVTPAILLAFTFLITMGRAFNNPAWHASVRDIVPRDILGRAIAINSTSINLARTVGPALGGVLVSLIGAAAAFLTNALSFLGMMIALIWWHPEQSTRTAPPEPVFSAIQTGVRYALRSPYSRAAMARGAISGFASSAVTALIPVLAKQELQVDAFQFGLLMAAYGIGAVGGAILGGHLRDRYSMEFVVRLATLTVVAGLIVLALSLHFIIALMGAAISGLGWVLLHSSLNTTVQLTSPRWVSGRALSLYVSATFAAIVIGSWVFGLLADKSSVYLSFWAAAGSLALVGSLLLLMKLPEPENINTSPSEHWKIPDLAVGIDDKDGQIIVELEYRITAADIEAFLVAMSQREQIRRRDGARDWELWRDLNDAERWVECYRVSNWSEYIRHNQRRTKDDMANSARLLELNLSLPGSARIKRYVKEQRNRKNSSM